MALIHLIALRLLRRPDGNDPGLPPLPIGGTGAVIGRAPDCDLVLDDPLRLVSRQHAQILPQGAHTALLRCISTSVSIGVNGDSVPPGGEVLVRAGDRLRIGGFELQVEAPEATAVSPRVSPLQMPQEVIAAPAAEARAEAEPAWAQSRVAPAPARPVPVPPLPATPSPVVPTRQVPAPVLPVATPAAPAAPVAVVSPVSPQRQPAPTAFSDSTRGRLDQWFDLDTVADPLASGSPLPMPVDSGVTPAAPHGQAGPRPPLVPRAGAQEPLRSFSPSAAAARQAPPSLHSAPSQHSDDSALLQAFLRGAGLDTHPQAAALGTSTAWMQHLGGLLRAATEGTLALLRSRAVTKRSIRAEGTQIAPRENNPLKFAPDAAEALMLMLGRQGTPGFLDPVDALRDAHTDLLVHQLAMVAGMRAAVFELISRFGPEAIEAQQGAPKGLARFVPALHQAALWQRHQQQHTHLVANLDDDFEAVFGREFLRAYEAQSRLAAEQRSAGNGVR